MLDSFAEIFAKGKLVKTIDLYGNESIHPQVQCWDGSLSKEEWDENPVLLFVCEHLSDHCFGQIVDTHEVLCQNKSYFLVKVLTATNGHPKTYWILANELSLLENE